MITVRPQQPFVGAATDPRLARLIHLVYQLHTTTRISVIRRFLALKPGDVCVEARRAESERLLRAQPFLQSARITAYADGTDEVRLDVFTVDALSGQLGIGFQRRQPLVDRLLVGSSNLFGRALDV
jgi:outer membrane protein assembly factor BamA